MKIAELLVNSLDVYFSVAMLSYQRVNAVCSLQSTRKHGEILDTSWELTMKSGTQSTTSCNQPSNIDVYSAKDGDPDLDYIIFLWQLEFNRSRCLGFTSHKWIGHMPSYWFQKSMYCLFNVDSDVMLPHVFGCTLPYFVDQCAFLVAHNIFVSRTVCCNLGFIIYVYIYVYI